MLADAPGPESLDVPTARYLIEKNDLGLWESSLRKNDGSVNSTLIEEVVQALPDIKNPDAISTMVKALMMERNLPNK